MHGVRGPAIGAVMERRLRYLASPYPLSHAAPGARQ